MPVKQRIAKRLRPRLTHEQVALWIVLREIQDERGGVDHWEQDGGRRHEYLDGCKRLSELLGLSFGDWLPLETPTACPPDYLDGNEYQLDCYRRAWALRCADGGGKGLSE
jgi:hypothetical protein